MITVRETENGISRIAGNPTLTSLDGTRKARLAVIMHESWTDEERAEFGIYKAEPAAIPDGKEAAGAPTFQRKGDKVVQVIPLKDAPKATPKRDLIAEIDGLKARVTALEGG